MGDVTAHLFGLVGIGAVLGTLYLASGVGSLIGPPLAGFLADATSGRMLPLGVVFVLATLGALVLTRLSPDPAQMEADGDELMTRPVFGGPSVPQIQLLGDQPPESGQRVGAS